MKETAKTMERYNTRPQSTVTPLLPFFYAKIYMWRKDNHGRFLGKIYNNTLENHSHRLKTFLYHMSMFRNFFLHSWFLLHLIHYIHEWIACGSFRRYSIISGKTLGSRKIHMRPFQLFGFFRL